MNWNHIIEVNNDEIEEYDDNDSGIIAINDIPLEQRIMPPHIDPTNDEDDDESVDNESSDSDDEENDDPDNDDIASMGITRTW